MSQIKELTKSQEEAIPQYLQKWLSIGKRTKTIDRDKAKEVVSSLYTEILNLPEPKHYLFLDSPMACNLALNLLQKSGSQLRSLDSQLRSQLYSQLDSQLDSQLGSQLNSQNFEYVYETFDNLYWAGYYGFYDFVLNELFPNKADSFPKFYLLKKVFEETHYTYLSPDFAVISDFPEKINISRITDFIQNKIWQLSIEMVGDSMP